MSDYKKISTSAEVWAVIKARHGKDLGVYSSFTDVTGEYSGGNQARVETAYAIRGADFPIMEAKTTWDIGAPGDHVRHNEQTEYWLCIALKDYE